MRLREIALILLILTMLAVLSWLGYAYISGELTKIGETAAKGILENILP